MQIETVFTHKCRFNLHSQLLSMWFCTTVLDLLNWVPINYGFYYVCKSGGSISHLLYPHFEGTGLPECDMHRPYSTHGGEVRVLEISSQ